MKLTVFYNGQFWVGIIEEIQGKRLYAKEFIFGSEPKEQEVLHFVQTRLLAVVEQLAKGVAISTKRKKVNPKRLARQVAKEMKQRGLSTYAQQAIKEQYEARKEQRKKDWRQRRKERAAYIRARKVQKKKEKHRGH